MKQTYVAPAIQTVQFISALSILNGSVQDTQKLSVGGYDPSGADEQFSSSRDYDNAGWDSEE